MPLHGFIPPVVVETDKLGQSYAVSNVEKADEYLLSWRDLGQGPEWRKALEVCLSAARGERQHMMREPLLSPRRASATGSADVH